VIVGATLPFDVGVEACGVVIRDMPPIGSLWLNLQPGLTVFYGVNGVGKSTVLAGIAAALQGIKPGDGRVELHCVADDSSAGDLWKAITDRVRTLARRVHAEQLRRERHELFEQGRKDEALDALWSDAGDDRYKWSSSVGPMAFAREIVERQGTGRFDFHSPRIVLVAAGTAEEPGWTLGVSAVPRALDDDTAGAAPADDASSTAPPSPVVLAEYLEWLIDVDDDMDVRHEAVVPADLRSWSCVIADDRLDPYGMTARIFQGDSASQRPPDLIGIADDGEFEPSAALRQLANELGARASAWVQSLTGEQLKLVLSIHHPNWWPTRGVAAWTAVDTYGAEVPVERLGAGTQRWAKMAIALTTRDPDATKLGRGELIIDEPELALHNAAQLRAAASFADRAASTSANGALSAYVASHSPAFLTPLNATVIRLTRDADNHVAARPLTVDGPIDHVARELGITRSDLLLAVRWLVLVEGTHDQVILETLYGEQFKQARAMVVPMHGADHVEFSLRVRDLVVYSDARVRLVLENIPAEAQALWDEARALDADGLAADARRTLEQLGRRAEHECALLGAAGVAALAEHRLQRTELVGLPVRDITHYLPVTDFRPNAESWQQLWDTAPPDARASGKAFKKWAGITTKNVKASVESHKDDNFPELACVLEGM
jgi:predicted ATPase